MIEIIVYLALGGLCFSIGSWYERHYGALRVRLKIGDVEASARTPDELKAILAPE